MAQFCRYCDHMLCGGRSQLGYCEIKNRLYTPDHLAHTNTCRHFAYNPIDALRRNPKGHTPKKETVSHGQDKKQTTIWDYLEE